MSTEAVVLTVLTAILVPLIFAASFWFDVLSPLRRNRRISEGVQPNE